VRSKKTAVGQFNSFTGVFFLVAFHCTVLMCNSCFLLWLINIYPARGTKKNRKGDEKKLKRICRKKRQQSYESSEWVLKLKERLKWGVVWSLIFYHCVHHRRGGGDATYRYHYCSNSFCMMLAAGMGYRPMPYVDSTLIRFDQGRPQTYKILIDSMERYLKGTY